MLGNLRKLFSGHKGTTTPAVAAFDEPPVLVIARRERRIGDPRWFAAKSWFGGAPKLGDMPWPRDAKGTPLYFMAQLDLAEIAAAGEGHSALPEQGAFAFFVGGQKGGAIVHVKRPGSEPTTLPTDLCKAEDIGGDSFVDRSHRFGPSQFPYWPVEFRKLSTRINPAAGEMMDRAHEEQSAEIARLYPRRAHNFDTKLIGEPPLYWLAAYIFAERVPRLLDQVVKARSRGAGYIETSTARLKALNAGLPPPPGQGRFGDPAVERANAEKWIEIGRKTVSDADRFGAIVEDYIAKVAAEPMGRNPWDEVSNHDAKRLDGLFDETRNAPLIEYSRYVLPRSWRHYAQDTIKIMASGPNEAFARLPKVWRDLINERHRVTPDITHLMFGVGVDIQGNEMFEQPDMRMVLQFTFDNMMYWPLGDNGAYQFWMPVSALRQGDVRKAIVTFEAH